jgi:hypothetical protein
MDVRKSVPAYINGLNSSCDRAALVEPVIATQDLDPAVAEDLVSGLL